MAEFDPFDVDVDDDLNDEEVIESSTSRKKEVQHKPRTHEFGDALAGDKKGRGRAMKNDGTAWKAAEFERDADGSAETYEGATRVETTTGDLLTDGVQDILDNPSHKYHKLFEAVRDNDANKGWTAINTNNNAWKVMQKISKHSRLRQYVTGTFGTGNRYEFQETEATRSYQTHNRKFKGVKGEPARITFLPTAQRTARLRALAKRKRK